LLDNDLDDEIIIGINRPKEEINKPKKKKVAKKATSKKAKKVDKKKSMKKKKILKFFVFIIILGIIIFLLNSSFFKITNVEINDNLKVTKEELEEVTNFGSYKNIFWINTRKIENEIKHNFAYIEDVEISRKLPNTVVITIEERVPKYMLQFADSYVYINNQGYMLEVSTENINLPIILGFKTDLSNIEVRKQIRY